MPKPRRRQPTDEPAMVKTTLLMPDDLWRRAKVRAIEEGCDLRDLLLEGLEMRLAAQGRTAKEGVAP
jgi:hypothetical protein